MDGGLVVWDFRMQHDFPEAGPGSRAFVPEDGPMLLARLIEEFLEASTGGPGDRSGEGVFSGD